MTQAFSPAELLAMFDFLRERGSSHLCCCQGQGSEYQDLFPGKDPRAQGHPERASPLSCQAGQLILADSPNT